MEFTPDQQEENEITALPGSQEEAPVPAPVRKSGQIPAWGYDLLIVLILILAAWFRLSGMNWDEGTYLHPDERFLVMVESAISPYTCNNPAIAIQDCPLDQRRWMTVGEYFDTGTSNMNPANRGYTFFVYGTFPIFLVRFVAEFAEKTAYGNIHLVGRPMSALADLGVVLLVYLIASKLYDRRVGILGALFSAMAVMQIQQSHFFTVDNFTNLFTWLALYFAVVAATTPWRPGDDAEPWFASRWDFILSIRRHPALRTALLFGIALGMAAASKVSAAPVAAALPVAFIIFLAQVPRQSRDRELSLVLVLLAMAAFVSLVTFRILQPYAFNGPGFFGIVPNQLWMDSMRSLSNQVKPDSGFPPSVQWYNRPIWFSGKNLVLFGMGLPMAIVAWAGFFWMAWDSLATRRGISRANLRTHGLILGWTGLYFIWQSTLWNPTMRYQLPVYPGLALMAGWLLVKVWDLGKQRAWLRGLAVGIGLLSLGGTFLWAYAFTGIYTRQITRIEASRWIYQNIPGPINLQIENEQGIYNQPLPFYTGGVITPGQPYTQYFGVNASGTLTSVTLGHVRLAGSPSGIRDNAPRVTLSLKVYAADDPATLLARGYLVNETLGNPSSTTAALAFILDQSVELEAGRAYTLQAELVDITGEVDLCAPVRVNIMTAGGEVEQVLPAGEGCILHPGKPYFLTFVPETTGQLYYAVFSAPQTPASRVESQVLTLEILRQPDAPEVLARASITIDPTQPDNIFNPAYRFILDQPVPVQKGEVLVYRLSTPASGAQVMLAGAAIANETSWDDGQPMRVDGYDGYAGIYQGGLNFELYWEDNQEKYERMTGLLDQADIIMITSSRQWGSLSRWPEKYPLVVAYYRNLIGCPEDRDIEWCYRVAEPGMFKGKLGFELIKVFQSYPRIGNFQVNTQFAEEAFTVYDHPKVFVFARSADYNPVAVRSILSQAPFSGNLITEQQPEKKTLLLPEDRLEEQRLNGTWSELFDRENWINRSPLVTTVVWYLAVLFLGWIVYPLARLVLGGLPDRGYPFARTLGLLALAYLSWLLGSYQVSFSRTNISLVVLGIALLNFGLFLLQRKAILQELVERKHYLLLVEGIALAAFLCFLLIRLGNPDLWHPWKGGEKPMDFSYFNAVLKSTSFPPYDPWFAGGYINYYYFGFVFVGVLTKLLGVVPATAYNLIIPMLFQMVMLGAFSLGWNLLSWKERSPGQGEIAQEGDQGDASRPPVPLREKIQTYLREVRYPMLAGVAASLGAGVLGNLGTAKMILDGYQRLASGGTPLAEAGFFERLIWTFQGFFQSLGGASLPYSLGDWYWLPSRAIPAVNEPEPITEFPFFTFIYADLHAHMMALPLAILALGWVLSVVQGKAWEDEAGVGLPRWARLMIGLLTGGMIIGVLRPTNTWDFPTYLALGVVALLYAGWMRGAAGDWLGPVQTVFARLAREKEVSPEQAETINRSEQTPLLAIPPLAKLAVAAIWAALLILFALFLYQPYADWYALGYTEVLQWKGTHTPTWSYWMHWGLFLFIILTWMSWLTIQWMATTPVSALRKLADVKEILFAVVLILAGLILYAVYIGVAIAWYVLPLAAWAGVLLLRPRRSDEERLVLFLVGTGLFLTLMVEIIVLGGDVGRMNTVFKFYLQVWILFAVSAAAALGWLVKEIPAWPGRLARTWWVVFIILVTIAGLYTLLAGTAKVRDRISESAPVTLDGMAYMPYSSYGENGRTITFDEDYEAILWMQENVKGSPVIVEANTVEYRWGSRFTIYTGLPGVVGWNWHQRQQRGVAGTEQVVNRVYEIDQFYRSVDPVELRSFLDRYSVQYIVVGQLERAYYEGPGIDKFMAYEGQLWRSVFRIGQTAIYEVIPNE